MTPDVDIRWGTAVTELRRYVVPLFLLALGLLLMP